MTIQKKWVMAALLVLAMSVAVVLLRSKAKRKRTRANHQCQWRARSRRVINGGLRQPAGDGIAMAKRNRKIGRPQPEKFLPDIQAVSMLRSKTPGSRNTFYIGQQ